MSGLVRFGVIAAALAIGGCKDTLVCKTPTAEHGDTYTQTVGYYATVAEAKAAAESQVANAAYSQALNSVNCPSTCTHKTVNNLQVKITSSGGYLYKLAFVLNLFSKQEYYGRAEYTWSADVACE